MISVLEAHLRSQNGPLLTEKEFNRRYQLILREVATKYRDQVKLNPQEIIPSPELGDLVFEAAVELIIRVGLYHMDTHRVVEFSRDEIMHTAKSRKSELTLGEGKDQVTIKARYLGAPESPSRFIGPAGVPINQNYYVPIHLSYAKVPEAQGLFPGTLLEARGFRNEADSPGELICALAEAEMMREVTRRAGKPGMVIAEAPMSTTSLFGIIASYNPNGYTNRLAMLPMQVFPGLRINKNHLILSAYAQEFGIEPWSMAFIVLGAFARDSLETAIAAVGGTLALLAINHANIIYSATMMIAPRFPIQSIWQTEALKNLAMTRNVGLPICSVTGGAAGPCTKMILQENAAGAVLGTVSGAGMIGFGLASMGIVPNSSTGMEGRIACEVAVAAAGIPREEGNRLLNSILALYEEQFLSIPPGKPFPECYDVDKVEPSDEYKRIYEEAKKDLKEQGIPFKY